MAINTIDPANPDPNDPVGQGDDVIRAFKQAIVDTLTQAPTDTPGDPWDIPLAVGPRTLATVPLKAEAADLAALDARVGQNEIDIASNDTDIANNAANIAANTAAILALGGAEAWPVGAVFISASGANPSTLGLPGTWTPIADGRVLIGGTTGFGANVGNADHEITLTAAQMAPHKHIHSTYRENASRTGVIDSVYHDDPAQALDSHLAGRDASSSHWEEFNTDEGVGLNGDPIDITPAGVRVRFFERTA